jgi:hypothetical protein
MTRDRRVRRVELACVARPTATSTRAFACLRPPAPPWAKSLTTAPAERFSLGMPGHVRVSEPGLRGPGFGEVRACAASRTGPPLVAKPSTECLQPSGKHMGRSEVCRDLELVLALDGSSG